MTWETYALFGSFGFALALLWINSIQLVRGVRELQQAVLELKKPRKRKARS